MCQHTVIAKNNHGSVLWCHDCAVYRVYFNSIVLSLNDKGVDYMKEQLYQHYEEHLPTTICPEQRCIVFETQVAGLHFCFSLEEVGAFLSLMQEVSWWQF